VDRIDWMYTIDSEKLAKVWHWIDRDHIRPIVNLVLFKFIFLTKVASLAVILSFGCNYYNM